MRLKRHVFVRILLLLGLLLSIASELDLCGTSACSEVHKYTLFGLSFAVFGIVFFLAAGVVYEFGRFSTIFPKLFLLMIFGAGGAEVAFLLIQKYRIQQWCPLCLGIAATVFVLALLLSFERIQEIISTGKERKVMAMTVLKKAVFFLVIFVAGFMVAYNGVRKSEAQESVPDIFLGDKNSSLEVYIITDWFCPACRKAEQEIERTVPAAGRRAKIVFVDFPVHPESLNYTPYNLSFLVNDKMRYIELRKALMTLTMKTKEPSPEQVQSVMAPLGMTYQPLAFLSVSRGMKFYDEIIRKFNVKSTPTVIVQNAKNQKAVRFVGARDVNETNILNALDQVSRKD
ncbi:MAG: thioredoxin domain-containing protein [Nitrospirae bacterium]|nr:thioredoxin domain-containing protein [Nitrospirota bacterium]